MRILRYAGWLMVWLLLGGSGCGRKIGQTESYLRADSLNQVAYALRYSNLATSAQAAHEAFRLAAGNSELRAEALNNEAFCAFMRMDFERASKLYRLALGGSDNEIESLIADVGMMKICQRTAMNKEFYDYRNSALRRMKRIREDEKQVTDKHLKQRLNYAVSEFYIVSGIYFYYLQQQEESLRSIDSVDVDAIRGDTAQWLYYMYMRGSGGMYKASTREKLLAGELRYLANCLMASRAGGYVYFEANALQALAELLNFRSNREILSRTQAGTLRLINDEGLPLDSLPLSYARRALVLFKQYGDWYQISGTYRTLATYYNYMGCPEKALPNLDTALHYVNLHHEKYYHCTDTADRLRTYVPSGGRSVELRWIADEGIKTVPEWILRLREQLSRTYSAMGMKQESDYNRNIYLDLLDYTRQDKLLESRYAALENESKQLNALLFLVLLGIGILIVLFVILNRRWKKRNRQYVSVLKQVFELCRKIISAVPASAQDMETVVDAVQQTVKEDFLRIFGAVDMQICLRDEESDSLPVSLPFPLPAQTSAFRVDLVSLESEEVIGCVWLALKKPLPKEGKALLQLVSPYLAWTLVNGANLVSLDDERRRVEKEQHIHRLHWAENKKENTVKKACLSIVTGILPYIDRIVNEVRKLESAPYARQESVKKGKYAYIDELITRINEYNDIIALWIKMRQGVVSLNIENFSLNDLFEMVGKGRRSFEMKRQTLTVLPTEAIVKADRALTLFMINTLAENARKYTPEGGRIELKAEEADRYVEISVTDNGKGISQEDVRRILGEKVYDSGSIGLDTADDVQALRRQKGHGFGLMNCKGIIEKYRKTNAVFDVCRFDIESVPGKGSRFYFRLPKGVKRALCLLGILLLIGGGSGCTQRHSGQAALPLQTSSYDSLLAIANDYANWAYEYNVEGYYADALLYADSALYYLNAHYLRYSGYDAPLLQLVRDDSEMAEQDWLAKSFDTDYYILLDVRNEAAVAALAVKDFHTYYYNNLAYTSLYKQISKDRSLESYCVQMRQSANNKIIALVLLVLLAVACLVGYYLLYLRHRLHYRYNMEQAFIINRAIFSSVRLNAEGEIEADVLLSRLSIELNELFPVSALGLALYDEETSVLHWHFSRDAGPDEVHTLMQRCFDKQEMVYGSTTRWFALPLRVEVGGQTHRTGVFAVQLMRQKPDEEDTLLVELVVDYLAAVLYNAVVRVRRKYNDIELAQDDARRALYEENMLHVQNLVLDNCLSTIKHETVYYPNRMKQIIDRLDAGSVLSEAEEQEQLQTVDELVSYYKDIFSLLSSCAARQLDEITFRRTEIRSEDVEDKLCRYFRKVTRKLPRSLQIETHIPSGLVMSGDAVLLDFLFENLVNEAVRYTEEGRLMVSACSDGEFVRFRFTDMRRTFTQEELNGWFYPSLSRMYAGVGNELVGTEFLICKQIIREHDEFAGRRGCRINACPEEGGGYTVWFTIPQKKRNRKTI